MSRWVYCERNTPIKERAELVAHRCGAVVSNYCLDEFFGGASGTESLSVGERSVETIIGSTHQCGDQLPGFPRQRIVLRCGGREVEVHAGAECGDVVAVELYDARYLSRPAHGLGVVLCEGSLGIIFIDSVYPSHRRS